MEFEINAKKVIIPHENLLSRQEFNSKVINALFTIVENKCAICYEPFDEQNPSKFLGGQCKCMTVYHEMCIKKALTRFKSCPTCRSSKVEIVDIKFSNLNIVKYEELFNKATQALEQEQKLAFIANWKKLIPSQHLTVSTLVDVYAYLSSFRYSPAWQECPIFDQGMTRIEFEDLKYTPGTQTIKDYMKFRKHFEIFTCNTIDDSFNWKGVVIAGGSISKLLTRHFELQDYPIDSDIDFFIYGETLRDRMETLHNTLAYFCKKYSNKVYFASKGYLIDMYIIGIERVFQIVITSNCNQDGILYNFDLDHVQVLYQQGQVLATPQFVASFKHQASQINNQLFRMRRIMRMKNTGLALLTTKPNTANVIKYTKERQKLFYTPHESDIFENIIKNIAEVSNISTSSITQDPDKCISMLNSNIPKQQDTATNNYGIGIADETFVLDLLKFDDFPGIQFHNKYIRAQQYYMIKYPGLNEILLELGSGNIHTKVMALSGEINVGFHYNDQEMRNNIIEFANNLITSFKNTPNTPKFVNINLGVINVTPKTKIFHNGKRINQEQIMFKNKVDQILISIPSIVLIKQHQLCNLILEAKEIRLM